MTMYVYVDNLKLCTEGKRLSAVKTGLAFDMHDAISRDVTDNSWTFDLGQLYLALSPPGESIGRSSLFGSGPLKDDSLWSLAAQQGFDVAVFDRDQSRVDVTVATQIMADSYEHMHTGDKVVLVAGERDYLPVIDSLKSRQFSVLVAFWDHATARELKKGPAEFLSLDGLFDVLTRPRRK